MAEPGDKPDDLDLLAAELALGVLDDPERSQARRRLGDPDFRAAVERWEVRFAPLLDGISDRDPPAGLWARIEARMMRHRDLSLYRSLRLWRAGAIAAALAVVILLATLVAGPFGRNDRALPPSLIAQLTDKAGQSLVLAQYEQGSGTLRVRTSHLARGDRVAELWVIPAGGKPHSLGVAPGSGVTAVALDADHRSFVKQGATLAVTLELPGGVPHAAPGGTILSAAPFVALDDVTD